MGKVTSKRMAHCKKERGRIRYFHHPISTVKIAVNFFSIKIIELSKPQHKSHRNFIKTCNKVPLMVPRIAVFLFSLTHLPADLLRLPAAVHPLVVLAGGAVLRGAVLAAPDGALPPHADEALLAVGGAPAVAHQPVVAKVVVGAVPDQLLGDNKIVMLKSSSFSAGLYSFFLPGRHG